MSFDTYFDIGLYIGLTIFIPALLLDLFCANSKNIRSICYYWYDRGDPPIFIIALVGGAVMLFCWLPIIIMGALFLLIRIIAKPIDKLLDQYTIEKRK